MVLEESPPAPRRGFLFFRVLRDYGKADAIALPGTQHDYSTSYSE
jgi:hypothetical protein